MTRIVCLFLVLLCTALKAAEAPNIVFILADDLAWADLGCYGHAWHQTPHLDQLARDGLRFTDAYSPAPICSASRASILTGKTPARLHFEFVTKESAGSQKRHPEQKLQSPPFTLNLPLEEMTIAEHLTECGYSTAFFGKWHLNAHYQGYLGWSPTHGPPQQGFDFTREDFGSHPYSYRKHGEPERVSKEGRYHTDTMTESMVEYIKQKHQRPFFLMASQFFVHTPVKTPYDWLLKKYDTEVPMDSPNRKNRIRYAAFLETFDHLVGELLEAIDNAGLQKNTLVVFTSDNGGHPEYTGNAPLRGSKWNLYEGGIRVPMLARWPGHIQPGSTSTTPVIGFDLLPTFVSIGSHGKNGPKLSSEIDGRDISQLFSAPDKTFDRALYWHFPYYHPETGYPKSLNKIGIDDFAVSKTLPQSAIRHGRYKLLHFYEDNRTELYDLKLDQSELRDLSKTNEGEATRQSRLLMTYLSEAQARFPQKVLERP